MKLGAHVTAWPASRWRRRRELPAATPCESLAILHRYAPSALFAAREAVGVRRVTQNFSLGVDRDGGMDFAQTKHAAELAS
jgi:hypothetical protein